MVLPLQEKVPVSRTPSLARIMENAVSVAGRSIASLKATPTPVLVETPVAPSEGETEPIVGGVVSGAGAPAQSR